MRICFLSTKHTPLDKRIFAKEAVSLAAAGYRVVHVAPAPSVGGERREGWRQGVEIVTFSPGRGLLGRLLSCPRVFRLAQRVRADCYHCNELDSWVIGLLIKAVSGSPVVFDVHEIYSTQLADRHCPRFLRVPVGRLFRFVFRLLARPTDRLVLAKPGAALEFAGSRTRQVLVQNYASLAQARAGSVARPGPAAAAEGRVTAVHLGLLSRPRGWPQLLEALKTAPCEGLRVHVIGSFVDASRGDFLRRCEELRLRDRIVIDDWMPYADAFGRLCEADIGLVLFQPGIANHVHALPHKLFDYMLAGLPVLVPDFALEVARIVQESDCGILVDSSDPEQIGAALARLAADPRERRRLGRNGRRAVVDRYNWEAEFAKLLGMYQEIERQLGSPGPAPQT